MRSKTTTFKHLLKDAAVSTAGFCLASSLFATNLAWCRTAETKGASLASVRQSSAQTLQAAGQETFERGDFNGAATHWREAARLFQNAGDARGQSHALASLGAAYQSSGQTELAFGALQMALETATRSGDRSGLTLIKNNLGSLYTFTRQPALAETALRESLQFAEQDKDGHAAALALNNLGNVLAGQERDGEAQDAYRRSMALAKSSDDALLTSRAGLNLSSLLVRSGRADEAASLNETASQALPNLADSHDKTQLLLSAARSARLLADADTAKANEFMERAGRLNNAALQVAGKMDDKRSLSQALGYLGEIAEKQDRNAEAAQWTRRARFVAQQSQLPDLLYQWDWQMGRLLKRQGNLDEAINAYRRAIETMRTLCDCNGMVGSDPRTSFRAATGPIYYQMADLLLQRSDSQPDAQLAQKRLIEARDTVELLKSAELSDYFQDACVTAGLSKVKDIEAVLKSAAVVYYIPLPDRTEILLGLPTGLQRFTAPVKAGTLTGKVRRLRLQLERPGTDQYLPYAQELYDLLLRPLESALSAANVKTLIFVPDGALRTVPLGALHDGKQFLIEKFSVAVTPGLTLMDPQPLERGGTEVFAGGVSEAVQGFEALDRVPEELSFIAQDYAAKPMLNRAFLKASVQHEITDGQYSIVHIASHGEFSSNPKSTYLLAYDGKLSLDDLENVIRPHQFQGRPVELLVLSACQTAAGDDRAALGLAGVAIKSGARSVLATLWSVSDDATSQLVEQFYGEIKRDPTQSKAMALQKAQIQLLRDGRFRHPAFWAPYLLIGNWL